MIRYRNPLKDTRSTFASDEIALLAAVGANLREMNLCEIKIDNTLKPIIYDKV